MALKLITPPADLAISVEDAIAYLKCDAGESRVLIEGLIAAATELAEQQTNRSLMPQTWRKTLDEFPDAIRLDRPPVIGVTSVKYYDEAGTQQTLSSGSYFVDTESEPCWIVPAVNTAWPATQLRANAVEVVYQAGYADADAVPEAIKQWMKLVMRATYDNPAGYVVGQHLTRFEYADRLLDRYCIEEV